MTMTNYATIQPELSLSERLNFIDSTVGTIRLNFLKLGARITVSVRRILIAIASSCPYQDILALAHSKIQAIPDTG